MLDLINKANLKPKLLPIAMDCDVSIELIGLLAQCRITQTFTNTSDEVIEAIHSIPIPVESTLTAFKVTKNNQSWSGKVYAQQEADNRYEKNLEQGNSAFQLKREDDFISLFLGNLLSKETLKIELSLIFPIQFIAGQGQLYLPLVMGKRYGQSNLQPEREPTSSFLAEYPFNLTLKAHNLPEYTRIQSPSHPLDKQGNGIYHASGLMDRDLKILFDDLPEIMPELQTLHIDDDNTLGLITMITPHQANHLVPPKDILFVLDCSGSMEGSPIQQLKESVYAMLGELRPQDRFNLYPYGSVIETFFDEPKIATPENIMYAKQQVRRNLSANLGCTETVSALLTALMSYQKDRAIDVILVTDGEIWLNEMDVQTKLVKAYAQQHNIRFFTVGVGHAASEKTVKTLAELSNGSYVITNPHEDIRFQMQAHFKRLFQSDVQVEITTPTQWHKVPKVYQGDALVIPLWFEKRPEQLDCNITINGQLTHCALNPKEIESPELIKWIADQRYSSIPNNQQTDFGVQYQILTDRTNFLIEMERTKADQTDSLATMIQIPHMQVHGRDDSMSMPMFSRKTNDVLDPPAFLKRSAPGNHHPPSFINYIQEKVAGYKLKQKHKQEQAEIRELMTYLNGLSDHPEQLDYCMLTQLKAPDELVIWLRLGLLNNELPSMIYKLTLCAEYCDDWAELVKGLNFYLET